MSCPILISSALIVSSLRQRSRGEKSHIEEMGYNLDSHILSYIERMGGLKRPTKKERDAARTTRNHNLRMKEQWERMEREEAKAAASA